MLQAPHDQLGGDHPGDMAWRIAGKNMTALPRLLFHARPGPIDIQPWKDPHPLTALLWLHRLPQAEKGL